MYMQKVTITRHISGNIQFRANLGVVGEIYNVNGTTFFTIPGTTFTRPVADERDGVEFGQRSVANYLKTFRVFDVEFVSEL